MQYQLGLSAEEITDRISPIFKGVGLLRGEYLCRKINKYVTLPECRTYMAEYLRRVAGLFAPDPVWYRFTEMEVTEVNVLEGVDHIMEEKTTMLGYRGVRRALLYRDTFMLEVGVAAQVAAEHANLHVLIPFIHDPSELVFVQDCLGEAGFGNQVGIMAEIPSAILRLEDFLELGIRHVALGMNDLSSLVLGAARSLNLINFLHPAVQVLVRRAREVVRDSGVALSVAGYFDRKFMQFVDDLGYDYAVLHYSKLPETLGPEWARLPHRENLEQIKADTRRRIQERAERLAAEKYKRVLGGPMQ